MTVQWRPFRTNSVIRALKRPAIEGAAIVGIYPFRRREECGRFYLPFSYILRILSWKSRHAFCKRAVGKLNKTKRRSGKKLLRLQSACAGC
jgi:hypothetical protein